MVRGAERILFTAFMTLLPIGALLIAKDWPVRASIVILLLGSVGAVLGLVQLFLDLKTLRRGGDEAQRPTFDVEPLQHEGRWGSLETWGWLLGLFTAIHVIGFLVALPLFVFLYAKLYGARWMTAILLAGATFGFLYGVFEQVLHVPWPEPLIPLPFHN